MSASTGWWAALEKMPRRGHHTDPNDLYKEMMDLKYSRVVEIFSDHSREDTKDDVTVVLVSEKNYFVVGNFGHGIFERLGSIA